MANNPAAVLKDVTLRYRDFTVLDRLNFSAAEGEVSGILGCIGSGKTRILRLIAGLDKPSSGSVEFGAGVHGRPLSYIFQQDLLVPWLTVGENLRLCLRDASMKARPIADWPICRALGLHLFEDKKPFQLSGGMRKKVNFARGFINDDPLVLMDEPFGALDPAQKREIQQGFLSVMKQGHTAVLVTHDIREALFVCDRISFLSMRSKRLTGGFENPFRGRFEANDLFAEPEYRRLYQTALDFYDEERRMT